MTKDVLHSRRLAMDQRLTEGTRRPATDNQEPLAADVVIVGGGGAGLPAALAAKEAGAGRVIVLEKRAVPGGNAALAWGIFGAESPVQKEALVEARKDDLFRTFMDWAHWSVDPRIVRALIGRSGETVAWLEGKGIRFDLLRYYPDQSPPVWHVPEGKGARLVRTLVEESQKLAVRFLLRTRGKKLLCDANHRVVGVLAEEDGREFSIEAQSVIIATGGYGGNEDLLRKHCPYYDEGVRCLGLPHSGDGLVMACEAGAATEGLGLLHLEWPHVHGDPAAVLATLAREPYSVYVNKKGERFIDESRGMHAFEAANAVLRQPGRMGYVLLDDEMRQSIEEEGAILGRGKDRAGRRRRMAGLGEGLRESAEADPGRLKIGESWTEIARWTGADPSVLRSTIDEYNSFCDRGYDTRFVKDRRYLRPLLRAPYYAIKAEPIFLETIGGIKVNERMEVLDREGNAIPGLYGAGVDTGGWEPDTYCDALTGAAFGFSVNSGRIAGEGAARFALKPSTT